METTYCANSNCIKSRHYRGGRFLFHQGDRNWYCSECYQVRRVLEPGRNLWDMVTTHGDGNRTHIRSLSDMRAYEKRCGVSNQLANFEERNCR